MNNFDLIEYLKKNRIFYRDSGKNVSQGEINICCIECGEEGYHLGINEKKQLFHCWVCSFSGNLTFLISKLENCSYKQAVDLIYKPVKIQFNIEQKLSEYFEEEKQIIENESCKLPPFTKSLLIEQANIFNYIAIHYLNERGIELNVIKEANLHYCYHGKFKNRIIIPIYYQGKLVNYVGRTWDKKAEKRYLNCSNNESLISTKNLLYNYDNVQNCDILIVVEGIFDCFKAGLDRSIATLGTEMTLTQKHLILSLNPRQLIILFDNGAFEKAKDHVDWFSFYFSNKVKAIKIKGECDPGDMTREEIDNLIEGT